MVIWMESDHARSTGLNFNLNVVPETYFIRIAGWDEPAILARVR